ncbi:oligosaccharide flippase family protein [uncultured Victivallis sp.]|uniref:oligosaccharide flippase family protein n=1 Tax=uncultured Victivallis sp. TaxID=354118 RepID=UPI0025984D65|nr:oligosaccharide flippase family protein [uncultured Victivallis sp.]
MSVKLLIKNTFYLYIITIIKILFPLLTLPYLTRILSIDIYGMVAYVKAYMAYVMLLLDFGFLLSATGDIAKAENIATVGRIAGDVFAGKIFLVLLSAVGTFILSEHMKILHQNQLFLWLYFISCALTVFIPDFLYRGIEKMEYVAIPFAASKTLVVILTYCLIKDDSDLLYIPGLEVAGNTVAATVSLCFLRKLQIRIRWGGFKRCVAEFVNSSIYFLSNFATTFFSAFTTIVVGSCMQNSDIAYWSLCVQIVAIAKGMYAPVANSLYPHMVKDKDLVLVRRIAVLFCIPLFVGSIIVIAWGQNILEIVFGRSYGYVGYLLKFLLPVIIFSFFSMLYGWPVLGAIGKIKETTLSTVLSALVQVIGIFLLIGIGWFNLISLAICCGISEGILLLIRLAVFQKNKRLFLKISPGESVSSAGY